jgi:hypothetical protein
VLDGSRRTSRAASAATEQERWRRASSVSAMSPALAPGSRRCIRLSWAERRRGKAPRNQAQGAAGTSANANIRRLYAPPCPAGGPQIGARQAGASRQRRPSRPPPLRCGVGRVRVAWMAVATAALSLGQLALGFLALSPPPASRRTLASMRHLAAELTVGGFSPHPVDAGSVRAATVFPLLATFSSDSSRAGGRQRVRSAARPPGASLRHPRRQPLVVGPTGTSRTRTAQGERSVEAEPGALLPTQVVGNRRPRDGAVFGPARRSPTGREARPRGGRTRSWWVGIVYLNGGAVVESQHLRHNWNFIHTSCSSRSNNGWMMPIGVEASLISLGTCCEPRYQIGLPCGVLVSSSVAARSSSAEPDEGLELLYE